MNDLPPADARRTILANSTTGNVELITNDNRIRSTWAMPPSVARSVARELTSAADIIEDVKPGEDPTPKALAREALEAVDRDLAERGAQRTSWWINAAETLARAVLENEEKKAEIETAYAQAKESHDKARAMLNSAELSIQRAEAYAKGRVDGIEAEKKASVSVYESREEWAKRAQAAERFITRLSTTYGSIVSSNDCSVLEIAAARACDRMLILDGGLGYVYRPRGDR